MCYYPYYTKKLVDFVYKLRHLFKKGVLTGLAGFEPTHDGVKVRCLTAWL
ncbi:hypothetical protein BACI9J_90012 [Bacillus altitudinis]|nr:hypothetical protein BACI9J_90012 [Bacillus altitudinis]